MTTTRSPVRAVLIAPPGDPVTVVRAAPGRPLQLPEHDRDRLSFPNVSGDVWAWARATVGGYVEPVQLTPDDEEGWHLVAYVNENGIAEGQRPCVQLMGGPVLHGPVAIVRERVDEEGECSYSGVTAHDVWLLHQIVGILTPVAVDLASPDCNCCRERN